MNEWREAWLSPPPEGMYAGVGDAFGRLHEIGDEEILERLPALNLERADASGEM